MKLSFAEIVDKIRLEGGVDAYMVRDHYGHEGLSFTDILERLQALDSRIILDERRVRGATALGRSYLLPTQQKPRYKPPAPADTVRPLLVSWLQSQSYKPVPKQAGFAQEIGYEGTDESVRGCMGRLLGWDIVVGSRAYDLSDKDTILAKLNAAV